MFSVQSQLAEKMQKGAFILCRSALANGHEKKIDIVAPDFNPGGNEPTTRPSTGIVEQGECQFSEGKERMKK